MSADQYEIIGVLFDLRDMFNRLTGLDLQNSELYITALTAIERRIAHYEKLIQQSVDAVAPAPEPAAPAPEPVAPAPEPAAPAPAPVPTDNFIVLRECDTGAAAEALINFFKDAADDLGDRPVIVIPMENSLTITIAGALTITRENITIESRSVNRCTLPCTVTWSPPNYKVCASFASLEVTANTIKFKVGDLTRYSCDY